jgi:hypothetical protein
MVPSWRLPYVLPAVRDGQCWNSRSCGSNVWPAGLSLPPLRSSGSLQ